MKRRLHPLFPRFGAACLLLSVACASPPCTQGGDSVETGSIGRSSQPLVYGTDSREDAAEHPDERLRRLAEMSTVTLMSVDTLDASNPSDVRVIAPTLQVAKRLCENQDQRFLEDPAAGYCSGTLIDHDLVLTSGHCVTRDNCESTRFVFNFERDADGELHVLTADDVFACDELVMSRGGAEDFAIVRLDRPATPRFAPARLRTHSTPLALDRSIAVIGSPSGIPLKIDAGARVIAPRTGQDYFGANLDTFGNSSGSGVYETGCYRLAGVLARGQVDYVRGPPSGVPAGCNVVNVCPDAGCVDEREPSVRYVETVTYVQVPLNAFCAEHPENPRLCQRLAPSGQAPPPAEEAQPDELDDVECPELAPARVDGCGPLAAAPRFD